jgi:phosphonate transport system substrate-binding protein
MITIRKTLVTATILMTMIAGCSQPEIKTPVSKETPSPSAPQTTDKPTTSSTNNANKPLVMVFTTKGEATEVKKKADAITKLLSEEIGTPVEAIVSDETAAVEALRADRADIAFLSSRPALKAEQLAKAKLYLAEVRPSYSGGHTYKSVLVVKKDSPLQPKSSEKETLGQLKGKKMAFASRTSGSGFIIPTGEFIDKGFVTSADRYSEFFGKVTYGDGYPSALQAVLKGQADVGAVSEYAVAEPYIKADEIKQLRVLYSIAGVPAHGISIDDDVSPELRDKIVNGLLKLNESKNNKLLKDLGNATQLVKVDHDQHLALMRTALEKAKIE